MVNKTIIESSVCFGENDFVCYINTMIFMDEPDCTLRTAATSAPPTILSPQGWDPSLTTSRSTTWGKVQVEVQVQVEVRR